MIATNKNSEIDERPTGPDWEWYVRDLVKRAHQEGHQIICRFETLSRQGQMESKQDWIKWHVGRYWDVDQLQKDWSRVLRGEQLSKVSSAEYCFDHLLLSHAVMPVKTEENARALSAALKEELPREFERYQSKGRTEIEKKVHESCCVKQKMAAGFLGLKDTRSIRYLADRTPPRHGRWAR